MKRPHQAAIGCYEKADTHRTEVPRLLQVTPLPTPAPPLSTFGTPPHEQADPRRAAVPRGLAGGWEGLPRGLVVGGGLVTPFLIASNALRLADYVSLLACSLMTCRCSRIPATGAEAVYITNTYVKKYYM